MADTQWPRFQVFLQEKPGEPHQDVGSVHAPDPELALLNARDVFVRRPKCISLWVVPAEAIFSRTAEELESTDLELGEKGSAEAELRTGERGKGRNSEELLALGNTAGAQGSSEDGDETYVVFYKAKPAGTQTLVGEVLASTPAQAMKRAVETYPVQQPPFAWWVFPARLVCRTSPEDIESMFAPAHDKPFRLSTDFHTISMMRDIKKF